MLLESNKDLTCEMIDQVWNHQRLDQIGKYIDEGFVHHDLPGVTSRDAFKGFLASLFKAFPDFKVDLEFQVAENDLVVHYQAITGTQTGPFNGMPATGKHMAVKGLYILRVCDEKVVEAWGMVDNLALMQQLGAVPIPQPA